MEGRLVRVPDSMGPVTMISAEKYSAAEMLGLAAENVAVCGAGVKSPAQPSVSAKRIPKPVRLVWYTLGIPGTGTPLTLAVFVIEQRTSESLTPGFRHSRASCFPILSTREEVINDVPNDRLNEVDSIDG